MRGPVAPILVDVTPDRDVMPLVGIRLALGIVRAIVVVVPREIELPRVTERPLGFPLQLTPSFGVQ
jgi:hypothetical protein